ncbi:MAG: fasciclin domain-containing protein [Phycisphaerales bacterium]|nr:fasciclin domain-containing protein [Phycisphaerales bacterium]
MKIMTALGALATTALFVQTSAFAGDCGSNKTASTCTAAPANAELASNAARKDIVDTAVAAGSFKTLVAAVQAADLVDALKSDGPFTVFAPSDDAFAKLPKKTIEMLLKPENKAMLTSILTYHVVPGRVLAADVVNLSNASTLNGQRIDIVTNKDGVMIDGAKVVATDIQCTNGVIHVIDTVIMPSTSNLVDLASEAGSFNTLLAAAQAAGLADTLANGGPFTVFAPTDEAFAKLPAGTVDMLLKPENKQKLADILKYHVVSGRIYARDAVGAERAKTLLGQKVMIGINDGRLTVNGANIVATDIEASNGVVHVIDSVLLPTG